MRSGILGREILRGGTFSPLYNGETSLEERASWRAPKEEGFCHFPQSFPLSKTWAFHTVGLSSFKIRVFSLD